MSSNWLVNPMEANALPLRVPPNVEPRVISSPPQGDAMNHCFYASVYHALMHIPIFLQWMRGHHSNTADCARVHPPCVRCNVKLLIQDYWQMQQNLRIPGNALYLDDIRQRAFDSGRIQRGTHSEAGVFYRWIIRELRDPMGAYADPRWNEAWRALFAIHYKSYDTCQTCHTSVLLGTGTREIGISLDLTGQNPVPTTIKQAVIAQFACESQAAFACGSEKCGGEDRLKTRHREIMAAPRVLVVTLKTFDASGIKIPNQILRLDETLDLTQFQEFDSVSLHYTLSSVLSHNGDRLAVSQNLASVRTHTGCPGDYWAVNAHGKTALSGKNEFLENPANPGGGLGRGGGYQALVLTYIRDGSSEEQIGRVREVANLKI
jgi:hypothetical protein